MQLLFITLLSGQTYIYWTDYVKDSIYRSDLDGSNQLKLAITGTSRGIAIDELNSYIYYSNDDDNKIMRMDIDGTNAIDLVTEGVSNPTDVAIDIGGGKIYWADRSSSVDGIKRANLDGTSAETIYSLGGDNIYGIALDLVNNKIYWTESVSNKIRRANLDGSSDEDLVTTGLENPYGIALDVANNYMYWTDYINDEVRRATLSGGSSTQLVSGLTYPRGIAIDFVNSKLFWTDSGTDDIKTCDITGGTATQVVTGFNGDAIALYGVGPTTTFTGTGNWSTAARWTYGPPGGTTVNATISGVCTVDDDYSVENLTVSSDASLSISETKSLTVEGTLSVASSKNSRAAGSLTIESDDSGMGSLIVEGTPTGDITVERYIAAYASATSGWHFLSTPVPTFNIDGSSFDPGDNDDLYRWEESTALWMNHKAGDPTQIVAGTGYLVAYESTATKTFTGTPNNSDISVSGLSYTTATSYTGWHLLGNPYPSALYWNKTTWSLSNVDAIAKIWVESSAIYTDIAATTGIIPATQGFMVRASASTGSLTIDATDRTHNTQNWYKDVEINKIKLIAFDPEGSTAQESIIKFNENATLGIDSEYDSYFLSGYAPYLYSAAEETALSTNTLPELKEELSIPLYFIKNSSSTFYIEAEGLDNLIPSYPVYLTDLKTDYTQNLTNNPVYSFTSEEGDDTQRFLLHFKAVGVEEQQPSNSNIQAWSASKTIYILNPENRKGELSVFNLFGQKMGQAKLTGDTKQEIHLSVPTAYYLVSIICDENVVTRKVLIE